MRVTVQLASDGLLMVAFIGEGDKFEMLCNSGVLRQIVDNIRRTCAAALFDPLPGAGSAPGIEITFLHEDGRGCTVVANVAQWRVVSEQLDSAARLAAAHCASISPQVGHA
jgi:hypothetical protein